MERSQNMGTLIGFDAGASRSRGVRRIDAEGSSPAACYALASYASNGDARAARVMTTAEVTSASGAIDATRHADVRRYVEYWDPFGPEAA